MLAIHVPGITAPGDGPPDPPLAAPETWSLRDSAAVAAPAPTHRAEAMPPARTHRSRPATPDPRIRDEGGSTTPPPPEPSPEPVAAAPEPSGSGSSPVSEAVPTEPPVVKPPSREAAAGVPDRKHGRSARTDGESRGGDRGPGPAVSARAARLGQSYLSAYDIDYGERVDHVDLVTAADALGVPVDGPVDDEELREMRRRDLDRAQLALIALDIDFGSSVDAHDVQTAAARLGVEVGGRVDPADVSAVMQRTPTATGIPTPRAGAAAGLELHVPSRAPRLLGFHEAAFPTALPIDPAGHPLEAVLPSRARATGATTALDVAVQPGTPVLAPVDGTIVEVSRYSLYDRYPDTRIRMVPAANPTLLVTVLHVTGAMVQPGQTVTVGDPIARHATKFPFASQIDRFADRTPHVHLEVRRR